MQTITKDRDLRHIYWLLRKEKVVDVNRFCDNRTIDISSKKVILSLRNLNLQSLNLTIKAINSDFMNSDFMNSDFRNSNFRNSDFSYSNFRGSNFRNSKFEEINISQASLPEAISFKQFAGFGEYNRKTTILYKKGYSSCLVQCGCFVGTLKRFEEKVNENYREKSEYSILISCIKSLLSLNKENKN